MDIVMDIGGARYRAEISVPLDISVPVSFGGSQVSVFGGPAARLEVYRDAGFTGSVAEGGSCNCSYYTFSPHLNGTHTECAGHILAGAQGIDKIVMPALQPAVLVTVPDSAADECGEGYASGYVSGDRVLTRKALQNAMQAYPGTQALILRTLPNEDGKRSRNYQKNPPPFLTNDAMAHITSCGIRHLLLDTPSADKMNDGGKLSNHRIFWSVPPGETRAVSDKTITELVYAHDAVPDGLYFLNLQVAAFAADAAPSRPVLYRAVKA